MFDIGWSELLIIAIVMVVVVGPKDLPKMLRAFGKATARMRSTANEFKTQFDQALKEAELEDVKTIVDEARKLNPRAKLTEVFDPIRSVGEDIRSELQSSSSMSPKTPHKVEEVTTPVDTDGAPVPLDTAASAEKVHAEKTAVKKATVKKDGATAKPRAAATSKANAPKAAAPKTPAKAKPAAKKPATTAKKKTDKTGSEA